MALRPRRVLQLQETVCRCFSTSRPILRKLSNKRVQVINQPHLENLRLRQDNSLLDETFGLAALRPQFTSSTNVNAHLNGFLNTVDRRIDNLVYSAPGKSGFDTYQLPEADFEEVVMKFKGQVMSNLTQRMGDGEYATAPFRLPSAVELYNAYVIDGVRGLDPLLLRYFRQFFLAYGHPLLKEVNTKAATQASDLRNPGEWYPAARALRRKLVMHVGPTNSGKTYQALQRLEKASSGWYGGPLRLLAHEVFNGMNNKGISCNLRTGEEVRIVDINARITASTIEMFAEGNTYDVAVIDEIQMIASSQRGYAWTTALLGLRASEIHLCGEEAAVPLITSIAKELGEEIEVHRYERLSPLTTESEAIKSYNRVKPGDCVVAFSRKSIFLIKENIERDTGMRCALVYGGLPPESRTMQADLFNDPNNEYDVIVASDAVGMGLNLNIKRVVFATMEKFDSGRMRHLYAPQIKQIAGRAGRFRVAGVEESPGDGGGSTTTIRAQDLPVLVEGLAAENPPLEQAMLWPPWRVFEKFSQEFPDGTPLATMVSQFADLGATTGHYRVLESETQIILAQAIEDISGIDLESRYSITLAPIATRNQDEVDLFIRLATVLAQAKPVTVESSTLKIPLWFIDKVPGNLKVGNGKWTAVKLHTLEMIHKLIMIYCWLSVRWPALYTNYNLAQTWKEKAERKIHEGLQAIRNDPPKLREKAKQQHDLGISESTYAAKQVPSSNADMAAEVS